MDKLTPAQRHYRKNKEKIRSKYKEWYNKNKEKERNRCRVKYENNKDHYRKKGLEYYYDNKDTDEYKTTKKEYYENNKEEIRIKAKKYSSEYRKINPDKVKISQKMYYNNNSGDIIKKNMKYRENPSARFNRIKADAKKRKIKFTLIESDVEHLWHSCCYYCEDKIPSYNFDRIDSNKGYEMDNIVPCCPDCNRMKWMATVDTFFDKIEKIYNNHIKNIIK